MTIEKAFTNIVMADIDLGITLNCIRHFLERFNLTPEKSHGDFSNDSIGKMVLQLNEGFLMTLT